MGRGLSEDDFHAGHSNKKDCTSLTELEHYDDRQDSSIAHGIWLDRVRLYPQPGGKPSQYDSAELYGAHHPFKASNTHLHSTKCWASILLAVIETITARVESRLLIAAASRSAELCSYEGLAGSRV